MPFTILYPIHLESTEPVFAHNRKPSTTTCCVQHPQDPQTLPTHQPTNQPISPPTHIRLLPHAAPSNQRSHPEHPNHQDQQPYNMSTAPPSPYDPLLYPNLTRYRASQPARRIPPPHPNDTIPRHPYELLPGDEWRRCPLCWCTKICVVLGRCVLYGGKAKVVFPQQ